MSFYPELSFGCADSTAKNEELKIHVDSDEHQREEGPKYPLPESFKHVDVQVEVTQNIDY